VSAPKRVVNEPAPAERTIREVTMIKRLPPGFIIPAQPVMAARPPSSGADWVHEIRHDGYRMIVRRDGPSVRLYSRNAYDWTVQLSAVATAAQRIKPRASQSTARQLCSGLTACHGLKKCAAGRLRAPRSSMPSTSSSTTARICAIAHSSTQGRAGPAIAQYQGRRPAERTHQPGRPCRLRARLPAWRRGHRAKRVDGTYRSGPCRFWIKVHNRASLRLDVGRPDHIAPLLGFVRDEFAKVGRTPADKNALAGESHCSINSCAKGLVAHALASGFTVEKISY
jgi:hypothetical protein